MCMRRQTYIIRIYIYICIYIYIYTYRFLFTLTANSVMLKVEGTSRQLMHVVVWDTGDAEVNRFEWESDSLHSGSI